MRLLNFSFFPIILSDTSLYPVPSNLSYIYSFGSAAGILLVIQIVSGIILSMHYVPDTSLAFDSIEHIMRDVNKGWLFRYMHSNGASVFFLVVYLHIGRGIYLRSYLYPRTLLWLSGIAIFFLMMATAFIGYVLPWGQMSLWGATVITNLFTVIPYVGAEAAEWLWGGFSVGNPTLNRFFSIHYVLPFIITVFVILHLVLLHEVGSSNPLEIKQTSDKISFYPYYSSKDSYFFLCVILIYSYLIFFYPNLLGHPDNYIKANPMVTPLHIVPEWYFLPFYTILRSIPNKVAGILYSALAIFVVFYSPFSDNAGKWENKHHIFCKKPYFYKLRFWMFISSFLLLGWLGSTPAVAPFVALSQEVSIYFFFCTCYLLNVGKIESIFYPTFSIEFSKD